MLRFNFIKTLTAGVALATAFYPQAWAVITETTSCEGKCTFYYDTESHDVRIEKNANVADGGEVIIPSYSYYSENINNVTIGEGITGVASVAFHGPNGGENTKLVLPKSLKTLADDAFWGCGFETIFMDGSNLVSTERNSFAWSSPKHIILVPSDTFVFTGSLFPAASGHADVQCRGKIQLCQNMMNNVGSFISSFAFYEGYNEDGNWEVWSDDGVALYADSTMQKPLGKYDFDGNQTGIYKYDGAGNLTAAYENGVSTYKRTSYTPAEAAKAVKKGNHNKVTLTFK